MALARAWKQMSWLYYQYLLVTALYMLEPWERTVFSILPGPWARGSGLGDGGLGGIFPGPGPGGRGTEGGEADRREPRARTRVSRRARVAEISWTEDALPRLGRPSGGEDS